MTRASTHRLSLPAAALVLGTALAAVGLIGAPDAAHAATITVTTFADTVDADCTIAPLPGPDGLISLREAVCAANADPDLDVIVLGAGTYTLSQQLNVETSIQLRGAGIDATTVQAASDDRVLDAFGWAGPISLDITDLTLQGGDVGNNAAGVIALYEVATHLERVRVTGGTALSGGGISSVLGQLTILDSEITGNAAVGDTGDGLGGGIEVMGASMSGTIFSMQRTTVSGNTAVGIGGGIVLALGDSDNATIEQSTISGNSATSGTAIGGYGGGLAFDDYHQGSLVVTDSTISGNTATLIGGAIHNAGDAASSLLLSNVTVTGNSAGLTGGIAQVSGFVTVKNSILAGNAGVTPDLAGAITGTNNLIGVAGAGFVDGVGSNAAGTSATPLDAKLGALADNGGPTRTHLPLAGSPAIDAIAVSCGAVDQRQVPRPQGAACDAGAVELSVTDTSITSGPAAVVATASATFVATGTSTVSPVSLECALDGAPFFVPCVSPVTVSGLADGAHTMLIRAVDSLGGTDPTPASHSWTVDTVGPTVSWGAVAVGTSHGDVSSFEFTAADALSGVTAIECSLDGAVFAACASPVTTASLGEGAHSFQVRAIDGAGNTGPVVERLWSVSAAPPVVDPAGDADDLVTTGGEPLPAALAALGLLGLGALLFVRRRRPAVRA